MVSLAGIWVSFRSGENQVQFHFLGPALFLVHRFTEFSPSWSLHEEAFSFKVTPPTDPILRFSMWRLMGLFCTYLAVLGLSCCTLDLHCVLWDLLLWHQGFSVARGLNSCGMGLLAPKTCGILLPVPGINPRCVADFNHWPLGKSPDSSSICLVHRH